MAAGDDALEAASASATCAARFDRPTARRRGLTFELSRRPRWNDLTPDERDVMARSGARRHAWCPATPSRRASASTVVHRRCHPARWRSLVDPSRRTAIAVEITRSWMAHATPSSSRSRRSAHAPIYTAQRKASRSGPPARGLRPQRAAGGDESHWRQMAVDWLMRHNRRRITRSRPH